MTIPKNAKGKNFSFSPSAIADYISCPANYAAKRFYVTLPYVETAAMKAGTTEHHHLEMRLKNKTPLPPGFTRGERFCRVIEASGGQVYAERQLAISRDMKFTSWFAKDAWGRCTIDVSVLFPNKVNCLDWKTGSVKEDSLQLKINACFLSLEGRDLKEYVTRYIWLKHNVTTGETFQAAQVPALWDEVLSWTHRMEEAWRQERFPERKNGLCRNWCGNTACKFCGK